MIGDASFEENPADNSKKNSLNKTILMYLHDAVYMMCGVLLVLLLCLRVVIVSGPSMNKTLANGDWLLLLNNVVYPQPKQGDIVVASKDSFENGEPIIKRVIATEGQTVDIDFEAGIVYVDNVALDEPYTNTPTNIKEGMTFPLVVEKGCLFLMGDNRNASKDSRSTEIGLVDQREILGKAIFLLFPGTENPGDPREFDRIGVMP